MNNQELARNLDFTVYTDNERATFTQKLLEENPSWHSWLLAQLERGVTDNSPAAQQLETLGNYIVYGKNRQTNKNAIEEKDVTQPATRYNTYARKTPLSLDELTDSPTFDEQEVRPVERNSYLTPKRTIVRPAYAKKVNSDQIFCMNEVQHDGRIVGMAQLWESIDYLEWLMGKQKFTPNAFSEKTYLVNGERVHKVNHPVREVDGELVVDSTPPATPPKLTPLAQYRLKHWLVDLKRHQYYLKESAQPTLFANHVSFTPPTPIDWEEDSGYWLTKEEATRLGKSVASDRVRWRPITPQEYNARALSPEASELGYTFSREKWASTDIVVGDNFPHAAAHFVREYYYHIAQHTIDFTNPSHVYALLEHYRDLRIATHDKLNSQMRHILDAFQEIVNRTELHESRDIILYYKIHKWTNERIVRELEEFGYSYGVNYISTIYKKEICGKIARQARIMDEEYVARNNPSAWRKCNECGERKLANSDNFTSKPKNYGGLSYRCKACDKVARQRRKEQ